MPSRPLVARCLLVLVILLQACQSSTKVVSDKQRETCLQLAEQATTSQQRREINAECLAKALEANKRPQTSAPVPILKEVPASPALPNDNRYLYCQLNRERIREASRRLNQVTPAWLVISSRAEPTSSEYKDAERNYNSALAELETLLPPEIRKDMDLLPTAVKAFTVCDRDALR